MISSTNWIAARNTGETRWLVSGHDIQCEHGAQSTIRMRGAVERRPEKELDLPEPFAPTVGTLQAREHE